MTPKTKQISWCFNLPNFLNIKFSYTWYILMKSTVTKIVLNRLNSSGIPYKSVLTFLLNFNLSMKNDLINFPHSNSIFTGPLVYKWSVLSLEECQGLGRHKAGLHICVQSSQLNNNLPYWTSTANFSMSVLLNQPYTIVKQIINRTRLKGIFW